MIKNAMLRQASNLRTAVSMLSNFPLSPTFTLTPRENLLSTCLQACAASLPDPPTVRFAGGWVRDKLLDHTSSDIDAALSNMSGKAFGDALLAFYSNPSVRSDFQNKARALGIAGKEAELNKIVLVEEDAEKSKHLAVAKLTLFGLDVDLVNLRTETYAADSRTPISHAIGTPEEDALRRDATINALFYNIHTSQVEDFTRRGLEDLKARVLRTPLDATSTFTDDPLRVLRLIRFASRFGFHIDSASTEAMCDPAIHLALRQKISRERVRIEVIKAFEGADPTLALWIIRDAGLWEATFADPSDPDPPNGGRAALAAAKFFSYKILTSSTVTSGLGLDKAQPYVPWLLAAYSAYVNLPADLAVLAVKEGLKATVFDAKLISAAVTNHSAIAALIDEVSTAPESVSRSQIGMALRRWGATWGLQMLFAMLTNLKKSYKRELPDLPPKYLTFLARIEELGLGGTKAMDEKPLLDGREIQQILARKKAGPGNKYAADLVMEWGFDRPGERDGVSKCRTMLQGKREEIIEWEENMMKEREMGKQKEAQERSKSRV